MTHDDLLARINELSAKKKADGLSEKEEKERKKLHQDYLRSFRSGFKKHLEGMKIVDEEGNDVTPAKIKKIQKKQGLHQRDKEE